MHPSTNPSIGAPQGDPSSRGLLRWCEAYLEELLVVGLLMFLVCSVTVEVFRRYILYDSGPYSEEIARFALIWMVYLGVPYAIKQRRHIICDVLPAHMSPRLNLMVNVISYGCFLAFAIFMVYENYQLVTAQIAMDKRTEAMQLPIWYFSIGIGVGFGLAAVRLSQALYYTLRAMRDPDSANQIWAWESEHEKGFD